MLSATGGVNPFNTTAFLDLWWQHFGQAYGRLSRAPVHAYCQQAFGMRQVAGAMRLVEACGAGVADFFDIDRTQCPEVDFQAFLQGYAHQGWGDVLTFPRILSESATAVQVQAFAAAAGLPLFRIPYEPALYLPLEGTWDDFMADQMSSKARGKFRRKQRRLDEMGGLRYEHLTSPAEVEAHLDEAFSLYARRADTSYRGPFWLSESGQVFIRAWASLLAEAGQLDLTFMWVGDSRIAFCFGFHNGVDYFHYGTAFDPDPTYYKYSPGILLTAHLIEEAFGAGYRRFDFLLGNEGYKQAWATERRMVETYILGNASLLKRPMAGLYYHGLQARQSIRASETLRPWAEKVMIALRKSS